MKENDDWRRCGIGVVRSTTHTSFLCGIRQGKGIRVGAGERKEV
jgi:hypothetical protein